MDCVAHDKCICWKMTLDERPSKYVQVGRDELSHVIRDNKWGGGEENNNKGRRGRRCSVCLSSPRLCCLLMTPPNVHLRSSLFRWALCRLVTDKTHVVTRWRHTDKQTNMGDVKSEHKCCTNTQHTKWHGSSPESLVISHNMEDIKKHDHKVQTWWTVRVDGWMDEWMDGGYRGSVKPGHFLRGL